MTENEFLAEERTRLRRLIVEAWSEKLLLTALFLTLAYPWLLRLAVRLRHDQQSRRPVSPFVYTLR